ncbi:MAG: extracellular solute-binding protein, partial [Pseudomonadota bacterium]
RRRAVQLGAGTAAMAATPNLLLSRPAQAQDRDKKLIFWLQPNFNETADQILIDQTMAYAKTAGLSDDEVEIVKVPGGELATRMAAALEVGAPPDVTRVSENNILTWRENGHLLDISDIVETMRHAEGGINESIMPMAEQDGQYYGAPMGLNPMAAHVRMDKFEAAGITEFPETWEAFIEAAKKVNQPPFYAYGMALGLTPSDSLREIMSVVWPYGGSLIDEQGRPAFESQGAVEAFRLINQMYNEDKIIPRGALSWDNSGNNKAFEAGQIAYALNPTSIYSNLLKNDSPFLEGTQLLAPPGGPDGRHRDMYADYYGVFSLSPYPDIAKGLISSFLDQKNYSDFIIQAGGRYFPVYTKMTEDPFWTEKPVFKDLLKTVAEGHTLFWPGKNSQGIYEVTTQTVVQKELQNVLVNGKDPDAAVADVQEEMIQIFQRLGQPT